MRRVILAIAATAVVLVLLLSFKTHNTTTGVIPAAVGTTTTPETGGTPAASASVPAASAPATASGGTQTVTGDAVQTIYGPVQIQIKVADGKVTAVQVLQSPDGTQMDLQIGAYALPTLERETIGVSSASIDAVSGATYTSQGYIGSLQSALDKAGL